MTTITLRSTKGSPLTNDEVDGNFTNLNVEVSAGTNRPNIRPAFQANFASARLVDSRLTFTRSSTATFFSRNGLLVLAATNAPRIDYNPSTLECQGILIEASRTNISVYSEQVTNAAYTKSNITATLASGIAPDGANTLNLIQENTATSTHFYNQGSTVTSGSSVAVSVFAKAGTRNWIAVGVMGVANSQLFVNLATGATGTIGAAVTKFSVQPLNNGLYRISVAAIATGIVTSGPEVYIASADNTLSYTGDGTSGLYVWGNQAESATFSSSYMPTVASTVVRSSDLLTFSGANFTNIFNASEGSVVINAIPNSPTGNTLNQVALAIGDGTGNNRIQAFRLAATGKYTFEVVTAGTTVTTISDTATWNEGAYGQLAFSYANASYAFSANGSVLTSSASGAIPTGLNKFDIGASSTDLNQFFGHIYRFAYYNKKITDIQVQNLAAL